MFHSRASNNRINKLHERSLRLVYDDYVSSFDELLIKDGSFTIHHQNIQNLALEIYKAIHDLSPNDVLKGLFTINNNNLRSNGMLQIPSVNTVLKGNNSLKYFGAIVWNSIPSEIKNLDSLSSFKLKIKQWKHDCKCRLCNDYIKNVGFVNLV